jgi:hypothetical protein
MSGGVDKSGGPQISAWDKVTNFFKPKKEDLPLVLKNLSPVPSPGALRKIASRMSATMVVATVMYQALKFSPIPVDRLLSRLTGVKTLPYGGGKVLQDPRPNFDHAVVDPSKRVTLTKEVEEGIRQDTGTSGTYIKPGGRQYATAVLKPYKETDSVGRIVGLGVSGAFTGNVPKLTPTSSDTVNRAFNYVFTLVKPLQYIPEFNSGTIGYHYEDMTIQGSPVHKEHGNLLAGTPTDENLRKLAKVETQYWHTHPGIVTRWGGQLLSEDQRFEFLKSVRDSNPYKPKV